MRKTLYSLVVVLAMGLLTCNQPTDPAPQQYTFQMTTQGEGSVILSPQQQTYEEGAAVTVNAEPATGWTFVQWEGNWTTQTNPLTITMSEDISLTAVFERQLFTLTTITFGEGAIQVTPAKNTYAYEEQVAVSVDPDYGWLFDHWDGDLGGREHPVSLTIRGDMTISAHFGEVNSYTTSTLELSQVTGDKVYEVVGWLNNAAPVEMTVDSVLFLTGTGDRLAKSADPSVLNGNRIFAQSGISVSLPMDGIPVSEVTQWYVVWFLRYEGYDFFVPNDPDTTE